jgi:hypothetical protein
MFRMSWMSQDEAETTNRSWRRFITTVLAIALLTGAVLVLVHIRTTTQVPNTDSKASSSAGLPVTYNYTCCSSSFVNTVYHPGEVIALHWIREINQPTESSRYTIILKEKLSGPFSSVGTLKSTVTASPQRSEPVEISAPVIRVSNTKDRKPVSLIHIPLNAATGYYNVSISILYNQIGDSTEGATIIRISS